MTLLVRPHAPDAAGTVLEVTPQSAGWKHVGFKVVTLKAGEMVSGGGDGREACLVVLTGTADVIAGDENFAALGGRSSVFEDRAPGSVYVPSNAAWTVTATTPVELAVCTAPGTGSGAPRLIGDDKMSREVRGKGTNTRYVRNILPETEPADSLLVVEVITPGGHWSSYPPHAAVANAKAAQPAWAATNPQRRARVMMKFVDCSIANGRAGRHAARRARQDHRRRQGRHPARVEVVEFACGAPHLLKGEYTDGAGPGIDVYSMRQPLGVVAGITPFNFPAMIPMWKFAPGDRLRQRLHPEAVGARSGVPMRLAELMIEAGCRRASSTSSTATRKPSTPSSTIPTSRRSASSARRRSPSTSIRAAAPTASACSASAAPRTT
jgi:hypothetical protein